MPIVLESIPDESAPSGKIVLESLPEPRGVGDQLARQAGLTLRHGVEGLAGIPAMVADPISHLAGAKPFSQWLSEALTSIGVPEAETRGERLVGDVSRGIAGAAGGVGLARGLASEGAGAVREAIKAAPELQVRAATPIADALAAAPGIQAAAGGVSAGSSGVARELGFNPLVQLLAGMVAPALGGVAAAAGGAAVRGAGQFAKPFTAGGREQVVGSTLRRLASDPESVLAGDASEIVPGSLPTTAQASKDMGLLQVERTLASQDPRFAARKSENTQARERYFGDIAGEKGDVQRLERARDAEANDRYGAARADVSRATPEVQAALEELRSRPAFNEAVAAAVKTLKNEGVDVAREQVPGKARGPATVDPLASALDRLTEQLGTKGKQPDAPIDFVKNGVTLGHATKLELDKMIAKAQEHGNGNDVRVLTGVQEKLLGLLDNPDFSQNYGGARSAYAEKSVPIDRLNTLQDIQRRTTAPGPDVSGAGVLSQAKWTNVVTNKLDELGQKLAPDHIARLRRIGMDLDRASLSDTAGRAAGSNTMQNLSTANILGAVLGDRLAGNSIAQSVMRPLGWLYKIPEAEVRDLLVQAMLSPEVARSLVGKATPRNVDFLGEALKFKARAMGLGAVIGAGASAEDQRDR